MCGIAGIATMQGREAVLEAMLGRIAHRGPDGRGRWSDDEAGIALGHLRLSIVDLSPAGAQPMRSASGRYVLTYNGELYNHQDIRHRLEREQPGIEWRGHSDTEVLLAAIERWGVDAALRRANGMFAFALWDVGTRELTLARDRFGEKPLYFGWVDGAFAFSSELKAFAAIPGWSPMLAQDAVAQYLNSGYIRGLQSAVEGVYRLTPASTLKLEAPDLRSPRDAAWVRARLVPYWSLADVANEGNDSTPPDADELEALLRDAVSIRSVADVPLGAFLSGGIDSSLIVALMQAGATRPVHTFSIGFDDPRCDEAPHARAVARHLGTDHHELYCSAADALALVPMLPLQFDEPFADDSQLPTLLVSRMARSEVTVALSGDGGDELFGGYGRYLGALDVLRLRSTVPGVSAAAKVAAAGVRTAARFGPSPLARFAQRAERLSHRMASDDVDLLRLDFYGPPMRRFLRVLPQRTVPAHAKPPTAIASPLQRLMYADQADYLPDDILFKVDRASMAYGLEARVPFLDPRVVALAWRYRDVQLVERRRGKQPLRTLLARHVPATITDRPKQGFVPPTAEWLRGPLRAWAEDLLAAATLERLTLLDPLVVRAAWHEHVQCRADHSTALWRILMLLAWVQATGTGVRC